MSQFKKFAISKPNHAGRISLSGEVEHEGAVIPFTWKVHEDEDVDQHLHHVNKMKAKAEAFVAKGRACRPHVGTEYPTAFGSVKFASVGIAYEGPESWHLKIYWTEDRNGTKRRQQRSIPYSDPAGIDVDAVIAKIVAEYPAAEAEKPGKAKGLAKAEEKKSGHQKHREALNALLA